MIVERLERFLDLYKLSLGSLVYCIDRMQERLEELGNDEAVQLAERARTKCHRARSLEYEWNQDKEQELLSREDSKRLDNETDATLSNLLKGLEFFAERGVGDKKEEMAEEVIEDLFPEGVFPITSMKFEDQHVAINEIVNRFNHEFAEHAEALQIADLVDKLDRQNETFGRALTGNDEGVTYDEVEAAVVEAEDAFHHFFVRVLGDYGDDMETLNEVVQPVLEQEERAARSLRERGTMPDVDPETGEPNEPSGSVTPGEGSGASPESIESGEPSAGGDERAGESPAEAADGGSSRTG